ncbi:MAG: D-glucuronyl C5-epimerase family protein [Elusimicrobiota bacterium]|nr:D-glucuronyl C5-epimerase family protein [Endomicrobiia bacterium]MDW8166192.1 D-glucuronyl C5-epimerase family protein [Elusimicrobiota bacterium]
MKLDIKSHFRKFIKWYRYLMGKSILHLPQNEGLYYSKEKLRGYYNDLRNKVFFQKNIDMNSLPYNIIDTGNKIYFPTTIIQYGLGAYDLYIETGSKKYLNKAILCGKWLIENQDSRGGWSVWNILKVKVLSLYSSMTQGEGASLLFRLGLELKEDIFLEAAEKALELMLIPIDKGGTLRIERNLFFLEELPEDPPSTILNGWIFSIFGLYDGFLVTNRTDFKEAFLLSIETLVKKIKYYDAGFWSFYDLKRNIASPFYHNLHISLIKVLFELTNKNVFLDYFKKWSSYRENIYYKNIALLIKMFQKLRNINKETSIIE